MKFVRMTADWPIADRFQSELITLGWHTGGKTASIAQSANHQTFAQYPTLAVMG